MRVIVGCEESQQVCKAFRAKGHEAYSCDVLPCSGGHPEWHIQGDALKILDDGWDLMIAHPPCRALSKAGNAWFNIEKYGDKARQRWEDRYAAVEFFMAFINADIPQICVENPVGYMSTCYRKPDQYVHPYMFGDEEKKHTGLWLKNLPSLVPTDIVEPKIHGYYKKGKNVGKPIYFVDSHGPSKDRQQLRSKFFPGMAKAMAEQWG